jgi:hypothetical protein
MIIYSPSQEEDKDPATRAKEKLQQRHKSSPIMSCKDDILTRLCIIQIFVSHGKELHVFIGLTCTK